LVPHSSLATLCFFKVSPTPEIYPLSLHDALPICAAAEHGLDRGRLIDVVGRGRGAVRVDVVHVLGRGTGALQGHVHGANRTLPTDRKSTRLNSSHVKISYAVFCLKKKKNTD